MNFEQKIEKELDKHERQWCDAVCPNVTKFGRQADKRIANLEAEVAALKYDNDGLLAAVESLSADNSALLEQTHE